MIDQPRWKVVEYSRSKIINAGRVIRQDNKDSVEYRELKVETESWLKEKSVASGYLFLNRFGERITMRGISQQLKNYAIKYGLNPKVVYPHSFRHRFAKNFLEKFNDISLLADLMGHESIETTRIYLRKTASEQQEIVDKIVTW